MKFNFYKFSLDELVWRIVFGGILCSFAYTLGFFIIGYLSAPIGILLFLIEYLSFGVVAEFTGLCLDQLGKYVVLFAIGYTH